MLLCDLPVELQGHISTFLSQCDLCSLLLCSRKAHASFLPALYHKLDLTVTDPYNDYVDVDFDIRLDKLVTELQCHPERCLWVFRAGFAWSRGHSARGMKIRAKMLEVFQLVPSLRSLIMRQINDVEFNGLVPHLQDSQGRNDLFSASHALSRMPASTSLQDLVFEDAGASMMDIYRLFSLPALRNLTIVNFHDRPISLSSAVSPDLNTTASAAPTSLAPASNIRHLSFIRSCAPGSSERYKNLFTPQGKLTSLSWEILTRRSIRGAEIGACLYALRDTLTELHLTRYWDGPMPRPTPEKISFAEFSSLKILDIHNHFLFAGRPQPIVPIEQKDWYSFHTLDLQLSQRLPASLEALQITFEYNEYAFKPWKFGDDDYRWVISLAQQSLSRSSRLSKVKLVVMKYSNENLNPAVLELEPKWVPPDDVRSAFEEARITLEKFVIPRRPGVRRQRIPRIF